MEAVTASFVEFLAVSGGSEVAFDLCPGEGSVGVFLETLLRLRELSLKFEGLRFSELEQESVVVEVKFDSAAIWIPVSAVYEGLSVVVRVSWRRFGCGSSHCYADVLMLKKGVEAGALLDFVLEIIFVK